MLLADPGLRRWLSVEGIDLSFIVETGHKNDGDLVKVFNIVKKALERKDGMGHKLKSISFADKKSCVAIQMADFLAYHVGRRVADVEENARKPGLPHTPIMQLMLKDIRHIAHAGTSFS